MLLFYLIPELEKVQETGGLVFRLSVRPSHTHDLTYIWDSLREFLQMWYKFGFLTNWLVLVVKGQRWSSPALTKYVFGLLNVTSDLCEGIPSTWDELVRFQRSKVKVMVTSYESGKINVQKDVDRNCTGTNILSYKYNNPMNRLSYKCVALRINDLINILSYKYIILQVQYPEKYNNTINTLSYTCVALRINYLKNILFDYTGCEVITLRSSLLSFFLLEPQLLSFTQF